MSLLDTFEELNNNKKEPLIFLENEYMEDLNTNSFYDIYKTLNEATDETDISIGYNKIKDILLNNAGEDKEEAKAKLQELMITLCQSKKGIWKTDPTIWPYQLQLMYNAYILECDAIKLLKELPETKLKEINKCLVEVNGLTLNPDTKWTFWNKEEHNILSSGISAASTPDLLAIDKNSKNYVQSIEVKGTVGSITNANSFHNADAAIIYLLSKDKQTATAYFVAIEDNKAKSKNSVLLEANRKVDCLEITVHDPKYPTVDNLEVNGKPLNPEETTGKTIANPNEKKAIEHLNINSFYNRNKALNEKWYTNDNYDWGRVWWSDSAIEFRNFIKAQVANNKSMGFRTVVGKDSYAIASAQDFNHDTIEAFLRDLYLPINGKETCRLGIPTIEDIDINNYETQLAYEEYLDDYEGFCDNYCDTSDQIPEKEDMTFGEFQRYYINFFQGARMINKIVCEGFEIELPMITIERLKQTETYKALEPLVKEIYANNEYEKIK